MNEESPFFRQAMADGGGKVPERPTVITVVCVIGVVGAALSVPVMFSDVARAIGAWYAPYMACSVIASMVCIIGLWKMRRWSVYLYAGIAVTNQLVTLSMGIWHFLDLLVPAVFAAIVCSQLHKMN